MDKHIGTKKTNKDSEPAMTDTTKAKDQGKERTEKKIWITNGREKWVSKCKKVKEEIKKEKELRLKEYVDELDTKRIASKYGRRSGI